MYNKRRRVRWFLILAAGLMASSCGYLVRNNGDQQPEREGISPAVTLPSSLHGTARGMQWWYEQPDGFGPYSGVPYKDAGCAACHVSTCDGCHRDAAGTQPAVVPDACKKCHGRINKEAQLQVSDVHLKKGMLCSDCHSSHEMHGDGNQYNSMLSPGAMDTKCENCHKEVPETAEHDRHGARFHCDACHLQSVITCYNCHFETLITSHKKKAAGAFKDFVVLLNDDNGKIRGGTYQSVVYKDKSFVAFGPYHGHSVTAAGRTCKDCHNSERMLELRDTGKVVMTRWDAKEGKIKHTTGVIPFVPERLEFQYVTLDGEGWVPLTTDTGRFQYKFCTPLNDEQLKALGATEKPLAQR